MTRRTDRRFLLLTGGAIAAVLTLCAAVSVAAWSVGTVEGTSTRVLTGPVDELMVESGNGDVTILPSEDGNIHVDGKAEGTLHAPAPRIDVSGSFVHVSSDCPVFGFGECHAQVTLRVPTGTAVTVDSGSGDLVARDVGAANLHTSSGDVIVDGSSGEVVLDSGSGDIIARGLRDGRARAETGSGDVDLRFATPPVDASADTGSGDIRILVPTGAEKYDVSVQANSGDQVVGVAQDTGSGHELRAESGSGDIVVDYGG
jgi:DUF4097 and DUF4098 domain-containing protein YvlB